MYLTGWRAVATYLNVSLRLVYKWHYEYLPLPFTKDVGSHNAKIRITEAKVDIWREEVKRVRDEIKSALNPPQPEANINKWHRKRRNGVVKA